MAKKDGAKSRNKSERFEVEETMSAADVAGYLEGLATGLREGAITIGGETAGFRVAIAGDVELEVEARHGKRKSRIELSMAFLAETPDAAEDASEASGDAGAEAPPEATIPDEMSF